MGSVTIPIADIEIQVFGADWPEWRLEELLLEHNLCMQSCCEGSMTANWRAGGDTTPERAPRAGTAMETTPKLLRQELVSTDGPLLTKRRRISCVQTVVTVEATGRALLSLDF